MALDWKIGFEIELLMPPGRSRLDLAQRVAERHGGSVRRFFHPQAELSSVEGKPVFQNLTPGFEVLDHEGRPVAQFVDDLTLQDGFDQKAPSLHGWYRMVTDDRRLVSLLLENCDPDCGLDMVLDPIAPMFGTSVERHESGMVKVSDRRGVSIAIGAGLPGERERGCEIVTAPLESRHEDVLSALLADAREEGCAMPLEGATHIHFDAGPLLSATTIARLVQTLRIHGEALRDFLGTNPNCIRLGDWPSALLALVETTGFRDLEWPAARKALGDVGLDKFCDFNLLNIVTANEAKHTFEVRILPSGLDAGPIIQAAEMFAAILTSCIESTTDGDVEPNFSRFLDELPTTETMAFSQAKSRSATRVPAERAVIPAQ